MPKGERMRKITISLPDALVDYADGQARALGTSRSQVVGMALAAVMQTKEEQLAAEGYRFYAQESQAFVDAVGAATAEAWADSWLPTESKE